MGSKVPHDMAPEHVRRILRERQFDSRLCWDFLHHFGITSGYVPWTEMDFTSPDMQAQVILSVNTMKYLGFQQPYFMTFSDCCDLRHGPRGNPVCWQAQGL